MPRIFLSHSSVDGREATALKRWLAVRDPSLRHQIFLDTDRETGLVGGEEWAATIRRNLDSCEAVLCLLSKNWEASKECYYEYKDAEAKGKTVFCARLDDSSGSGLISRFQRRELFATGAESVVSVDLDDGGPAVVFAADGLGRLLADLRSARLGADSFVWPPADDTGRAPYRGWSPFEPKDAAVFFGRDPEIGRALAALEAIRSSKRNSMFVILGPSGTGKSSFLRAGLLPRLGIDSHRFSVLDVVRPGRDEALTGDSGLAASISHRRQSVGLTDLSLGAIKQICNQDPGRVRQLLLDVQGREPEIEPVAVLPVDQAEELFSPEAGPEAAALLGLMRDLLAEPLRQDDSSRLRLIVAVTIRTDRYEVMQTAEELAGIDTVLFDDLKPMRADRFRQVIEGPARRSTEGGRRLTLDPGLVEQLILDATASLRGGGDTLPLLSGTLSRLHTDYGMTGELTLDQYVQLGGIRRVVQTEIDKILSSEPSVRSEELAVLREAFIPWLATVSDQDEPMRRIALWSDLPPKSLELIGKFVEARILIRDRRRLGDAAGAEHDVIEIALESFLRQWDELAGWLREQREELKAADELLRDVGRWRASGRGPEYLYGGSLLEKAEILSATSTFARRLEPSREFLVASRQQASRAQLDKEAILRRNTLRLSLVLAVTVAVALVAVGAFFWARHAQSIAQRNAQDATAQKLVAEAQSMLADSREGDDIRALYELLVANQLAGLPDNRPLLEALVDRFALQKVLTTAEPVLAVNSAPDGHLLAMAEPAGVRLWDTSSPGWQDDLRQTGRVLSSDESKISSMAMSRDGRIVVTGHDDGTVRVWNTIQQNPVARLVGRVHEGRVTSVAVSENGRIASAGVDGVVDLTSADGVVEAQQIATGGEIFTVAFDPTGDRIALGRADGMIQVAEFLGGAANVTADVVEAHRDGVMSVEFSPDGRYLASGGADSVIRLWDAETLSPERQMTGHTAAVTAVAFSEDSSRIVSGGNDLTVRVWDVASGAGIGDPMRGHGGLVLSVAFVAGGNVIASGGNEHTLRLWDADFGQPISTPLTSRSGPVTDVAISPDGQLIASGGTDRTVRVRSAQTGAEIAAMSEHSGVVTGVAFNPLGGTVASASADGTALLWRPGSLAPVARFDGGRPLTTVEISPNGDLMAVAGVDGQIILWQLPSGRMTMLENKDHAIVYGLAFDPRGERLATVSVGGHLRMWRIADGQQLWERSESAALPADIGATEELAAGYPGSLISVAFSPDGERVASGGVDWTEGGGAVGFLQRWDAASGEPLDRPIKVGNAVMDIAFSPRPTESGADRLVIASFDPYEVQLWNTDNPGSAQYIFPDHQAQVVSVAVSPDGRRIVSGSADGDVRIWPNLPSTSAEAAICSKLSADMTETEWREWISPDIIQQPTCLRAEATAAGS